MSDAVPVMVASPVYGVESLLDQVYAVLDGFGYKVWMSHKGTVPIDPKLSNFENCLAAVDNCAVFVALITGRYGSGKDDLELSITHREVLRAIERDKLRWFLVHRDVEVARIILRQFRFTKDGRPKNLRFQATPVLEDVRVLDMYEAATRADLPLRNRTGNWVQQYIADEDVLRFLTAQFADLQRIRKLISNEP